MMLTIPFLIFISLLCAGEALPSNVEVSTENENSTICSTSGQVTNIIIQRGGGEESGETGPPGPPGPVGPTGQRGVSGAPGPAGPAGPAGFSGPRGETGASGFPGESGRDGALGATGPAGPQGPAGLTGETGPAGVPGPTGSLGERGAVGQSGGGVSFTQWGRTTCPNTEETQLLYDGTMAGSAWYEAGTAEYLCLHKQAQFLRTTPGKQTERAYLYGTEYRALNRPPAFSSMRHHDAPCAVCYTPRRNAMIAIPGRIECPTSWTREYYGYLMTEKSDVNHKSRVPVCVDARTESVAGSAEENTRSLLYFIETTCAGISCPPYSNGAELTCVVCTK